MKFISVINTVSWIKLHQLNYCQSNSCQNKHYFTFKASSRTPNQTKTYNWAFWDLIDTNLSIKPLHFFNSSSVKVTAVKSFTILTFKASFSCPNQTETCNWKYLDLIDTNLRVKPLQCFNSSFVKVTAVKYFIILTFKASFSCPNQTKTCNWRYLHCFDTNLSVKPLHCFKFIFF